MSEKVFITGLTGFVGSHLADFILEKHPYIEILGLARWRSPTDNINHILHNVNLVHGDLTDNFSLRKILSEHRPNIIYHLAAQSYVPYSFDVPIETLSTNIIGTCNLLEVIKELKLQDGYDPFIHICSSSEVYGQVKKEEIPITENNPFRPASPYAVSKVGEDMLAYQYYLSWELNTVRTRMFTHTGPRRGSVFVVSTFAKQIAAIEVGKQSCVKVGNLDSIRTFLDVRDAVKAYWLLQKCPPGEVYNIGGKETMTVGEMLSKLVSLSKTKIDVVVDPTRLRPSDVTRQIPCIDKFVQATGWQPTIPFSTTLRDTLEYWREYYNNEGA